MMPEILMPSPAQLQPYARTVRVGAFNLHCYVAGPERAPSLLLLHGLGDEADSWRRVFVPLSARYRVIAPDLPGFGRSDKPQRAYSVAFFARTILALMVSLGTGRTTLVGSSLGGMVAQRIAIGAPERIERLVLIDGCLPVERRIPSGPIWAFLAPGVGELAYTRLRRSPDEAYATLRPYYANIDAMPAEEQAFLRARVWARVWSDGQRRAFLSALRWLSVDAATRADAYRDALRTCHVPTLLIWGDADLIAPPSIGAANAALLPNAQVSTIAGCGHLPHQEQPEQVIELLG